MSITCRQGWVWTVVERGKKMALLNGQKDESTQARFDMRKLSQPFPVGSPAMYNIQFREVK